MEFGIKIRIKETILALGAESAGNFSVYKNGTIYFSDDFGDLLDEKNWLKFQKSVQDYLKKNKLKPDTIVTDLHPSYVTMEWGRKLAKKFKARHVSVQHHIAHIFSAIAENYNIIMRPSQNVIVLGIAADGTGYGSDGKIWGGEIFEVQSSKSEVKSIRRVGHLENQVLIGGDLAVKEPARMLIAILAKISNLKSQIPNKIKNLNPKIEKQFIYKFVKKHYSKKEFEVIYSQLKQGFNCLETSSSGRILDAVSVQLGFSRNERKSKHAPIEALEKNSTKPYKIKIPNLIKGDGGIYILPTTDLFEYLIKNLDKDKKRLAATAQLYLAQGFWEIVKNASHPELDSGSSNKSFWIPGQARNDEYVFFAGGVANNKIISEYLEKRGVMTNKKIPRGDAGLSFGQLMFYLANARD